MLIPTNELENFINIVSGNFLKYAKTNTTIKGDCQDYISTGIIYLIKLYKSLPLLPYKILDNYIKYSETNTVIKAETLRQYYIRTGIIALIKLYKNISLLPYEQKILDKFHIHYINDEKYVIETFGDYQSYLELKIESLAHSVSDETWKKINKIKIREYKKQEVYDLYTELYPASDHELYHPHYLKRYPADEMYDFYLYYLDDYITYERYHVPKLDFNSDLLINDLAKKEKILSLTKRTTK